MDNKFILKFTGYWIVNTLVLALADSLLPYAYELGNANIHIAFAALFSSFLLTVMLFFAKGLARSKFFKIEGRIMMFIYYWGAASAAVWVVARIADISGFGIARFTWAIGAGFVISATNWLVRQSYKGINLIQ